MVASYSPTSGYRSSGRQSVISQVTQSVKDALVYLRTHTTQSRLHPSFAKTAFVVTSQTISQLATLPERTFGHQWLTLIEQEGAKENTTCCTNSLNVLTGYSTDPMGKAELHAFLFGATGQITSLVQCLENLHTLNQAHMPKSSGQTTEALGSRLYQAYQRGRTSYFDIDNWHPEQLWDLPLPFVRQWFGLSEQ